MNVSSHDALVYWFAATALVNLLYAIFAAGPKKRAVSESERRWSFFLTACLQLGLFFLARSA